MPLASDDALTPYDGTRRPGPRRRRRALGVPGGSPGGPAPRPRRAGPATHDPGRHQRRRPAQRGPDRHRPPRRRGAGHAVARGPGQGDQGERHPAAVAAGARGGAALRLGDVGPLAVPAPRPLRHRAAGEHARHRHRLGGAAHQRHAGPRRVHHRHRHRRPHRAGHAVQRDHRRGRAARDTSRATTCDGCPRGSASTTSWPPPPSPGCSRRCGWTGRGTPPGGTSTARPGAASRWDRRSSSAPTACSSSAPAASTPPRTTPRRTRPPSTSATAWPRCSAR